MDGSTLSVILGLTLPLTGTTLGAAMVFFMRRELGDRTQKALMGFASGIMIAASVWSLLIPAMDMARELGLPEARIPLADAVILVATAPKSNSVTAGIGRAWADVRAGRTGDVPRELQNVHADSAGMEREQGYLYPHDFPRHWVQQQYLPDALKGVHYYEYGDNKTEQAAKHYWDEIKGPQP